MPAQEEAQSIPILCQNVNEACKKRNNFSMLSIQAKTTCAICQWEWRTSLKFSKCFLPNVCFRSYSQLTKSRN